MAHKICDLINDSDPFGCTKISAACLTVDLLNGTFDFKFACWRLTQNRDNNAKISKS